VQWIQDVNHPIISRLSSIGRGLYERVMHSNASAEPEPDDDAVRARPQATDAASEATDREVAQDLAFLDVDQLAGSADEEPETAPDVQVKDGGDLYGVHVAHASDRAHVDDDQAFDDGQSWVESLQTHAAEGGPEPEQEVDIVDEDDLTSPSGDSKDRPIADRGSAGPRGL
jgi:hypothetical protein